MSKSMQQYIWILKTKSFSSKDEFIVYTAYF